VQVGGVQHNLAAVVLEKCTSHNNWTGENGERRSQQCCKL